MKETKALFPLVRRVVDDLPDGDLSKWALLNRGQLQIELTRLLRIAETAQELLIQADAAPIPLTTGTAFAWDQMARAVEKGKGADAWRT